MKRIPTLSDDARFLLNICRPAGVVQASESEQDEIDELTEKGFIEFSPSQGHWIFTGLGYEATR